MRHVSTICTGICVIFCLALAPNVWGVTPGQVDTFQDGTTMDWVAGIGPNAGVPPVPPANAVGGPAGAGDLFLALTATGGMGAGSRMVGINAAQWTGDYLASGITGIEMDVNNMGPVPLELRMRFEHFSMPGPPTGDFMSANSITLPAMSGWQSVFFPINPVDLADLNAGGGDDYVTTMSDVGVVRLLHAPDFSLPPPVVESILGVDNIRAVPEPTICFGALLVCIAFLRGRGTVSL